MMLRLTVLAAVLTVTVCEQKQWSFNPIRANEQPSVPAWYQAQQQQQQKQAYPAQYERHNSFDPSSRASMHQPVPQPIQQTPPQYGQGYQGYPSFGSTPRSSSFQEAKRFYPATVSQAPADITPSTSPMPSQPQKAARKPINNIDKYAPLLKRLKNRQLKKLVPPPSTSTQTTPPASVATRTPPRSIKDIYSTIQPRRVVPSSQATPGPEQPQTSRATPFPTRARFICRHRTLHSHSSEEQPATLPFRAKITQASTERARPTTTAAPSTTTESRGLLEMLLWPNAELLSAIKDVVTKFKASLDESGLDQDVRLMGNQLKNTWQQLRAGQTGVDRSWNTVRQSADQAVNPYALAGSAMGVPGPMNEQLGRLFERAQAVSHDAPVESEQKRDEKM